MQIIGRCSFGLCNWGGGVGGGEDGDGGGGSGGRGRYRDLCVTKKKVEQSRSIVGDANIKCLAELTWFD